MLTSYQLQVQDLIDDPNNTFVSLTTLTRFINNARNRVALDTQSIRSYQSFSLAQGVNSLTLSTLTPAIIGVLNVFLDWNNLVYPLPQRTFTFVQTEFLAMTTFQSVPVVWCTFGKNQIMLGPVPDQAYTLYIDGISYPDALVDDTTVEQLSGSDTDAVQYYAAYLCFLKKQDGPSAKGMLSLYQSALQASTGVSGRILSSPYGGR